MASGTTGCSTSEEDTTWSNGRDGGRILPNAAWELLQRTSAKHFASWLGLSPNNRVTGGKVLSSQTKPSANRAAAALRLAANALHRSDSALGTFLRHKLARIIYSTAAWTWIC